jgi:protein SCO1
MPLQECNRIKRALGLPFVLLILGAGFLSAQVQRNPQELEGVGVTEKLGASIDLDLTFIADNGQRVSLRSYFEGKNRPVLLNMVYYTCPMLCNLVLNGQTAALRELSWTPGNEFEIITVSIDPTETFDLARKKKVVYLSSYERPAPGWHFLVDHQGNAQRLADQVGFNYKYDEFTKQYAHAAALMVLTPDGRVSRYVYGIKPRALDLRLALTEASEFKFFQTLDRLLLYCFHYDPDAKSYVPFAINLMKLAGGVTVLIMGCVLWVLFRRERRAASTETFART